MWPATFQDRLIEWYHLRQQCSKGPLEQCLLTINDWWFQSPWRPYYLHWDDRQTWPTPWDLLADNVFCDLARALGILYTIMMVEHPEVGKLELTQCDQSNLVLVNDGKCILNWSQGEILNITSTKINILHRLDSGVLHHLMS